MDLTTTEMYFKMVKNDKFYVMYILLLFKENSAWHVISTQ